MSKVRNGGLWEAWIAVDVPCCRCSLQRSWTGWPLRAFSNWNNSMILWFCIERVFRSYSLFPRSSFCFLYFNTADKQISSPQCHPYFLLKFSDTTLEMQFIQCLTDFKWLQNYQSAVHLSLLELFGLPSPCVGKRLQCITKSLLRHLDMFWTCLQQSMTDFERQTSDAMGNHPAWSNQGMVQDAHLQSAT